MKPDDTIQITYRGKVYHVQRTAILLNDLKSIPLPVNGGCLLGFCGVCKIVLSKGTIEYNTPPLASLRDKEVLTCISSAQTDIEIDLC